MIEIFHGDNEQTHQAFQSWRQGHVDGFHMTEGASGVFTIHWTQDKRENLAGRGCHHQGESGNKYLEDKYGCYTTARKICSESYSDLLEWAKEHKARTKNCGHCDSKRFPFPNVAA